MEEKNPLGELLLHSHGEAGLVFVKMVGTIVVLGVLVYVQAKWRAAANMAVVSLATFQLGLVVYL
jgi:hypothetical protein